MERIEKLKKKVTDLYQAKKLGRADWSDWLFQNHIFVVAKNAEQLSNRFGVNNDLAVSASMLHDIADTEMQRENPEHEEKSKEIARKLLEECNFAENEVDVIVNDAIEFHGCKNGNLPETIEGKIMATADALTHLKGTFYDYALETLKKTDTLEEIKNWALPKIERDYRVKISFDEVREETINDYERVKGLFNTN